MPLLAIPLVVAVVVALLALLLLLGLRTFAQVTGQFLPDWHILGFSSIRDFWINAANSAYNAVLNAVHASLKPIGDVFMAPVTFIGRTLDNVFSFASEVYGTIYFVIHVAIPRAVQVLRNDVNGAVASLKGLAAADLAQAKAFAQSVANLAHNYAHDITVDLRNDVNHGLSVAAASLATGLASLRNYVDSSTASARAFATAAANASRSYALSLYRDALSYADKAATTAAAAAVGVLSTGVGHAVAAEWSQITGAVDGVIDVADGAFADSLSTWRTLSRTSPQTIAGAVAALGTLAIPLIKLTEECTIPNCRNLSGVGRELQAIFGLVEGVALLDFLGEAIRDPAGTAETVSSEVDSLFGGVARAFESLIGV